MLQVARVSRTVKGGRRMRFRVVVVIGNRKGQVGVGIGKAGEVQAAVKKAASQARRRMIHVPIVRGTIPHEVDLKFKAAKIRLMPAGEGTGLIAGGALRPILELAGVKNVLSKRFGTNNQLVNAQAAIWALKMLREPVRKDSNASTGLSTGESKESKETKPTSLGSAELRGPREAKE